MQGVQSLQNVANDSVTIALEPRMMQLQGITHEKSFTPFADPHVVYREASISEQIRIAQLCACYQLLREIGFRARQRGMERERPSQEHSGLGDHSTLAPSVANNTGKIARTIVLDSDTRLC